MFDAAWVSLRTTDNSLQRLHQFYEFWPFGDLCHVVARWLPVATTEIHFKTCFCAVCQDIRPPFFQDFFRPTLMDTGCDPAFPPTCVDHPADCNLFKKYNFIKFALIRPSTLNHDRNIWNCRGTPDEATCLAGFYRCPIALTLICMKSFKCLRQ